MEQKWSKSARSKNPQRSNSGPESLHSGADFDADGNLLVRQFSGPKSLHSGAKFTLKEDAFLESGTKLWARGLIFLGLYIEKCVLDIRVHEF